MLGLDNRHGLLKKIPMKFLSSIASIGIVLSAATSLAHDLPEILVQDSKSQNSASSQVVTQPDLQLTPILETGEILEVAPGLIVIQHAGGGKANQYYLRGFDADHGTDIAFSVDEVPVNNVTHAHGQGYSDFNFVIPELIDALAVRKGPYFVQDGDFATAGAVNMKLQREFKENRLMFQAGRFDNFRGLAILGAGDDKKGFFIANDIYTNNGPFVNPEDFIRYNLFARGYFESGNWKATLTATSYTGDWNASGQIPLPLVESGALSRFGSLDPTEGGESHRHQFYGNLHWEPDERQNLDINFYTYHYDLDLFSNFTFFLDDPVNGDQIEQKDQRQVAGFKSAYSRLDHLGTVGFRTSTGAGLRFDHINTELNHTRARSLVDRRTKNRINQFNPYFYAQEEFLLTNWFRFLGGVRLDVLNYNVADLLGGSSQGDATALITSPKASAVFSPLEPLEIYLNFGQGFHSNDARGVLDPVLPASKYAKATGAELGIRSKFFGDRLALEVAGWYLHLDSELVFVGDEGTTEAKGATNRYGVETSLRYQILDWLWADVDFTYTHARFEGLPSGMNFVPLAPTYTVNGGISAKHRSGFYGSLRGRAISDRPANEADSLTAEGYMVWDMMAGYRRDKQRWLGSERGAYALQLNILNLFNANYRESQFDTTSRPDPLGPEITAIHFTPGYPLTILGSASLFF
jgi:hypothetical protein